MLSINNLLTGRVFLNNSYRKQTCLQKHTKEEAVTERAVNPVLFTDLSTASSVVLTTHLVSSCSPLKFSTLSSLPKQTESKFSMQEQSFALQQYWCPQGGSLTLQATSTSLILTDGFSGSFVPITSRVSSSWARTWWDSAKQSRERLCTSLLSSRTTESLWLEGPPGAFSFRGEKKPSFLGFSLQITY